MYLHPPGQRQVAVERAIRGIQRLDQLRPDQQECRFPVRESGGSLNRDATPGTLHHALGARHDSHRDLVHGPDETGGEGRARFRVDLARRANLFDSAAVHDDHSVADGKRFRLVVRDQDRRDAELRNHPADLGPKLLADLGVHRAERLVEQQYSRLYGHGTRQSDALLLTAGHMVWVAAGNVRQPEQLQELRDSSPPLCGSALADGQTELHVLGRGHVGE